MVSGDYTFLLQHVIIMRRSCFDTDFVSQIKLAKLPLIHCFGSNLKIVKCIKMYYFTRKQGRPKKPKNKVAQYFSQTQVVCEILEIQQYFCIINPHIRSMWETICDALHIPVARNFGSKFLEFPTQVFQEWSGVPPPNENLGRSWHFEFARFICTICTCRIQWSCEGLTSIPQWIYWL